MTLNTLSQNLKCKPKPNLTGVMPACFGNNSTYKRVRLPPLLFPTIWRTWLIRKLEKGRLRKYFSYSLHLHSVPWLNNSDSVWHQAKLSALSALNLVVNKADGCLIRFARNHYIICVKTKFISSWLPFWTYKPPLTRHFYHLTHLPRWDTRHFC